MEEWRFGIQLELKYCERCGGLWLRPRGSDVILCEACAKVMAGLVSVWPRSKPSTHANLSRGSVAYWGEGGNA